MVYVLASFLLCWADRIRSMEFQDLIMFLQVCVVVCVWVACEGGKGGMWRQGGVEFQRTWPCGCKRALGRPLRWGARCRCWAGPGPS